MSGGWPDLGLLEPLVKATEDQGWMCVRRECANARLSSSFSPLRSLPSDVQDEAIPLILGGGDVMAVRHDYSHAYARNAASIAQHAPTPLLAGC